MSERSTKSGVVTSRSGWVQSPGICEGSGIGRAFAPAVRVSTRVEVQLPQTTPAVAKHAAGGIGSAVVLVWRLGVYLAGVGVWTIVRLIECAAAVAVGAERMMGGGRWQLPTKLLYWQKPEGTGIEVYRGDE